jgi:Ca2+-binding RTX toxin-like protein
VRNADGDVLVGIENLIGTDAGDTLEGDGNANTLRGGRGNDALIGGARARDGGFAIKGKTAVRIIHPKRRRVDGLNLGASGAP